jgi:hypothetical protein
MVRIDRDVDAQDEWGRDECPNRGLYAELSRPRTGMWGAVTARAAQHVMRLSLITAIINGSRVIRREHQNAAYEVWRYAADSAKYIFGDTIDDPTAVRIVAALRQAGRNGLTRTQIWAVFNREKPATEIQNALIKLAHAGLVVRAVRRFNATYDCNRQTRAY